MGQDKVVVSADRQIARAAGTIMLAFALSNLIGLARQILVSRAFGTARALDAFYAASTYPDLIFNLVAGGALGSAFIPTFTSLLARGRRVAAWNLALSIANLVLIVLSALSLLSAFFAPQIIRYFLAPDFPADQQALAASLLRILLVAPTLFGLSGLLMGVLNAHQRFLLPALAPSMYWLGMIFGLLFLVPSIGIYGLAWGAVLGAGLHLGIQVPDLLRLLVSLPRREGEGRLHPLGLSHPAVLEVGRLMGPRLLGVAVVQINFVVNTIIASGLREGSLAAIKYAWQIMTMPQVVIAQAIAIAALPTFSAQEARGERGAMRASLATTLRGVLFLSLPAALGLILLRRPLIALLFQRGPFDAHSTELVAWALLWYALGLIGHNVVEVLSRAFYALHDTRTPVFVGAAAMTCNILFNFGFAALFGRLGWMPHGGLALANSLATALEMTALLVIMHRRLRGLDGRRIGRGLWQAAAGTLCMSGALLAWLQRAGGDSIWRIVAGAILGGSLVYGLTLYVLGVPELITLLGALRRRLGNAP